MDFVHLQEEDTKIKGEKMTKVMKVIALGSLLASSALYAAGTAGCVGCHGANFEKVAMGKSKVVKDMSKADIIAALKGYKDGSYGGAMKGLMKGQVASLDDAAIEAMAAEIKGGGAAPAAAAAPAAEGPLVVDINKEANSAENVAKDDLGNKKVVTEEVLGLRKTNLYAEEAETEGMAAQYSSAAPGTSQRIERAFQDAPPMIPHSVEGMLPIKTGNNQCVGCHAPEAAAGVGAVPIPPSHFTDFRPKHKLEGQDFTKSIDNYKNEIAISKKKDTLVQARFNCSQCHAPQSTGALAVSNTFEGGFSDADGKSASNWYERMDDALDTVGDASYVTAEDLANKNSAAGSLDH